MRTSKDLQQECGLLILRNAFQPRRDVEPGRRLCRLIRCIGVFETRVQVVDDYGDDFAFVVV